MGALMVMFLLFIIWRTEERTKALAWVMLWIVYEETLVAGCSVWRMYEWWSASQTDELCSKRIGVKLGTASIVMLGALIYKVAQSERTKR